eukprot:408463_1
MSEVSVMQLQHVPTTVPTTAGYSAYKRGGTNSAMNTPTLINRPMGDERRLSQEWPDDIPIIDAQEMQNNLNQQRMDEEKQAMGMRKNRICGVMWKDLWTLNRDDVYGQRSKILFDPEILADTFKKKMGKDFCLNAAAAKIIFTAGMQDKGCTLDEEQLEIIYCGGEFFLPMYEWDLPQAITQWVLHDETKQDKTSRAEIDNKKWDKEKLHLPSYLKHELVAFIFGETYFDLTETDGKKKQIRHRKGEPVVHRNTRYQGSCVSELHNSNLPKKKYSLLVWGYCRQHYGTGFITKWRGNSILHCVSFFMPLSDKPPDENGKLEIKALVLDRTFHPEKMSADEGYNEYDSVRVKRTGRITTIPYEAETGKGGCLLLKVYGELFVERHATVDADSCGYQGGWHHKCQGDSLYRCGKTSRDRNFGGGGGGYYAGGGGYGTPGEMPEPVIPKYLSNGRGGRKYGTHEVHIKAFMGSGGGAGGARFLFSRGGRGGGVVVVIAGSIHNKVRIMALGERGRYLAGSGAGGSIVVECNSYYHYGKGGIIASSLQPYPDIEEKCKGGIGGRGRVAMKINRQKWTAAMKKAISSNNAEEIWDPVAWIYPSPYWVTTDRMNEKELVHPRLVGFRPMPRVMNTVYKHDRMFRVESLADGPLINKYHPGCAKEMKAVDAYEERQKQEKETAWDWKFEEFALHFHKQAVSQANFDIVTVDYKDTVKGKEQNKDQVTSHNWDITKAKP